MEPEIFDRFKKKNLKLKCHENLIGGSWAVPRGGAVGQTDITKVIVAFHNISNTSKN